MSCTSLALFSFYSYNASEYLVLTYKTKLTSRPYYFVWQRFNQKIHGQCISTIGWNLAFGIVNFIEDLAVWALPIRIIYTIKASLQQKLQVAIILCAGSIACVAGIFRIYYAIKLGSNTVDWNWAAYPLEIWSSLELSIGVICGSLPACKILLKSRQSALEDAMPNKYGKKLLHSEDTFASGKERNSSCDVPHLTTNGHV
jgi:hypothetical protein